MLWFLATHRLNERKLRCKRAGESSGDYNLMWKFATWTGFGISISAQAPNYPFSLTTSTPDNLRPLAPQNGRYDILSQLPELTFRPRGSFTPLPSCSFQRSYPPLLSTHLFSYSVATGSRHRHGGTMPRYVYYALLNLYLLTIASRRLCNSNGQKKLENGYFCTVLSAPSPARSLLYRIDSNT